MKGGASRVTLAVALLLVVVVVCVTVLSVVGLERNAQVDAATAVAPLTVTAPISGERLRDTVAMQGVWQPEFSVEVDPPTILGGSKPVVTQVPTVGSTVSRGQAAFWVAGRPVIALVGELPMYRTISPGDCGPDVSNLQAAIYHAGLGLSTSGCYDQKTRKAVEQLYERVGSTITPSGEIPLGELVFVPSVPVDVASVALARGEVARGPVMTLASQTLELVGRVDSETASSVEPGMLVEVAGRAIGEISAINKAGEVSVTAKDPAREPGDTDDATIIRRTAESPLSVPTTALVRVGEVTEVIVHTPDGFKHVPVQLGLRVDGRIAITDPDQSLSVGDQVVVAGPTIP